MGRREKALVIIFMRYSIFIRPVLFGLEWSLNYRLLASETIHKCVLRNCFIKCKIDRLNVGMDNYFTRPTAMRKGGSRPQWCHIPSNLLNSDYISVIVAINIFLGGGEMGHLFNSILWPTFVSLIARRARFFGRCGRCFIKWRFDIFKTIANGFQPIGGHAARAEFYGREIFIPDT